MKYYDMEFHRGGRDARPENTLYSYQYSLENGALTIECDMQMTADGHIVMSHNPALNPDLTTDTEGRRIEDGKYYIHDMTLQEVQSFNVGHMDPDIEYYELHGRTQVQADICIPSLHQMFELVRDSGNTDIRMSIEAKVYPDPALGTRHEKNYDYDKLLREFLSLVNEFGFRDRVILQCFDWALLVKMKEMDPGIRTIALYSEQPSWGTPDATTLWLDRDEASPWLSGINIHDFDGDPVRAAHSLGIDDVSPYYKEITKELTDEAHGFGMKVVPWTVNSREDIGKIYEMGVDGIITDRPWVLREFLEERGEKLPPARSVDLPYHLEPDHYTADDKKADNGRDAAY
jgi:glycerophosphoryl diester phosphodiesterase